MASEATRLAMKAIESGCSRAARSLLFGAAAIVLASCSGAGSEARCVYRQTYGSDMGGQLRWGPCNNQNPTMHPLFGPDQGSGTR